MSLEILGASALGQVASPIDGLFRLGLLESVAPGQLEVRRVGEDLRDQADAVLVGPNTVLLDNPSLAGVTASGRQPVRVTLDPSAMIPLDYRFLDGTVRTLIGVSEATPRAYVRRLEERGIEPVYCGSSRVDLKDFLAALALRGLRNILVEGGGRLNRALLDQDLVDRVHLMLLPLPEGVPESQSAIGRLVLAGCDRRGSFLLLRYESVANPLPPR